MRDAEICLEVDGLAWGEVLNATLVVLELGASTEEEVALIIGLVFVIVLRLARDYERPT